MVFRPLWTSLRSNVQYLAAFGAGSIYLVTVYPQVWGIRKYMKLLQFYRNGDPLPLDKTTKSLAQEVLDKMKLHPSAEANVQVFISYGQDPLNKGSTFTTNGGLVGLPIHMTYISVNDVEKNKMTVLDRAINWESEIGLSFLNSLVLSPNAKRFVIAREISYLDTHHVQLRSLLVSGYFSVSYLTGFGFSRVTKLSRRAPFPLRLVVYGIFGGLGYVAYSLHNDAFNSSRDNKADKRAGKLGKDYAEGGVEFYDKMLQRNVALRTIMQQLGPQRYTAYGNDMQSWRSPNVPLTMRRDNLVAILNSYTKEDT